MRLNSALLWAPGFYWIITNFGVRASLYSLDCLKTCPLASASRWLGSCVPWSLASNLLFHGTRDLLVRLLMHTGGISEGEVTMKGSCLPSTEFGSLREHRWGDTAKLPTSTAPEVWVASGTYLGQSALWAPFSSFSFSRCFLLLSVISFSTGISGIPMSAANFSAPWPVRKQWGV